MENKIGADLPLDVSSRVEALLSLVSEIGKRVKDSPAISGLLRDFREMAQEYILLFESSLRESSELSPREKWLSRHEMLDKLTTEWHLIYSLASATELGSPFLAKFQPYVDQAVEDIGLADAEGNFLLIPTFGESFSLVTVRYSTSNIAILKLPISVIHSPWEVSVIWHEMAGLKVIKIRQQITDFLEAYAEEKHLDVPVARKMPDGSLLTQLFDRIVNNKRLDADFKNKLKEFFTFMENIAPRQDDIWSQDWFEQLYEDACSVFAFGESFVPVLEKILGRQARKLSADRKHPDLTTRIQVAKRLLALQKKAAPPPANNVERLTDDLLWAFIDQNRSDSVSALPVAYLDPENVSQARQEVIDAMRVFNEKFGDLLGTINEERFDFGHMAAFSGDRKSASYISEDDRAARVREKLLELFANSDLNGLLNIPFSASDELDFESHTAADQWQNMYIGSSSHGGHNVYHWGH